MRPAGGSANSALAEAPLVRIDPAHESHTNPFDQEFDEIPEEFLVGSFPEGPPLSRIRVFGEVTDPEGNPLDRATIVFTPDEGSVFRTAALHGRYETARPYPGSWTVQCRLAGYCDREDEVLLVEGEKERRVDLVLEKRPQIEVFVRTPGGRSFFAACDELGIDNPTAALHAIATEEEPPPRILPSLAWDAVGQLGVGEFVTPRSYTEENWFETGLLGRIELDRPRTVFVSIALRNVILATTRVREEERNVTLIVAPEEVRANRCRLRFRMVDAETHAPLAGAKINVFLRERRGVPFGLGEDGVYESDELSPGLRTLEAHAEGFEYARKSVLLAAGESRDLGDWPLRRGVRISGRFVDPKGQTPWIEYVLHDLDAPPDERPWDERSGHALPSGEFVIEDVGRGRFVLVPLSEAWASEPTVVDCRDGSVEGLRIDLRPGTLLVIESGGRLADARYVRIATADGTPILSDGLLPGRDPLTIRLVPACYRLLLMDPEGKETGTTIDLASDPVSISLPGDR